MRLIHINPCILRENIKRQKGHPVGRPSMVINENN